MVIGACRNSRGHVSPRRYRVSEQLVSIAGLRGRVTLGTSAVVMASCQQKGKTPGVPRVQLVLSQRRIFARQVRVCSTEICFGCP